MSLNRLMKNFFSVASDNFAPVDSEGAINRDYHIAVNDTQKNLRCAIQGVSKRDVVEIFGKREDTPIFVLFHQQRNIVITSGTFILTHVDPFQQITDFSNIKNIIVYQYVGQRDPVLHKPRNVPLEIFIEKNNRWHS